LNHAFLEIVQPIVLLLPSTEHDTPRVSRSGEAQPSTGRDTPRVRRSGEAQPSTGRDTPRVRRSGEAQPSTGREAQSSTEQPIGPLVIQLQTAPELPVLGGASKQVGEVLLLTNVDGKFTAAVSLGKKEKLSAEIFRQAGGGVARWLLKSNATAAELDFDEVMALGLPGAGPALLEGILLGSFQFNRYKKVDDSPTSIALTLRTTHPSLVTPMVTRAQAICSAVNLARDWAHEPANILNPVTLAERVTALAEQDGLQVSVLNTAELAEMGAGGILNVSKGSSTPPCLIVLQYPGHHPEPGTLPVVLIGKALTFDSGGYSMKSVENIQGMKYDKCGGVTVAAMLHLASQLKLKNPLIGIIAAAENMVSGEAYRPDDILHMLSGTTVEIISTDAEGRLVLADALTYAQNQYPSRAIIDLATLTGGVVVSLGHVRAGLMTNNDALFQQLFEAGEETHERLWRLPLDEDFVPLIKGGDADIKNSGGREGHCILGGIFLQQFVPDSVAWAHLDIAGMADTHKDLPYCPKGATGFGIRLLTHYLESL